MMTALPNKQWSTAAFIQARMSSQRFPGKVLAPFRGQPVIRHILTTVADVESVEKIIVLTSRHPSDDPLAEYVRSLGFPVFRGPLHNVFKRFQDCARTVPCDWILRLCADSPLLDRQVIHEVIQRASGRHCDVVTTRFRPPFPKGQNADLIRRERLLEVDLSSLTDEDREHVATWFYRNPQEYIILDAQPVTIHLPKATYTVDTPADLERLERLCNAQQPR